VALKLLVVNGGRGGRTAKMLAEQGIKVSSEQLTHWKTKSFPGRYAELRRELAPDVNETVAGQSLERVLERPNPEM